jgi:hypothetical protein
MIYLCTRLGLFLSWEKSKTIFLGNLGIKPYRLGGPANTYILLMKLKYTITQYSFDGKKGEIFFAKHPFHI